MAGYSLGGCKESYVIEHAHMGVEIYHFQEDLLRVYIPTDRTPGLQFRKNISAESLDLEVFPRSFSGAPEVSEASPLRLHFGKRLSVGAMQAEERRKRTCKEVEEEPGEHGVPEAQGG